MWEAITQIEFTELYLCFKESVVFSNVAFIGCSDCVFFCCLFYANGVSVLNIKFRDTKTVHCLFVRSILLISQSVYVGFLQSLYDADGESAEIEVCNNKFEFWPTSYFFLNELINLNKTLLLSDTKSRQPKSKTYLKLHLKMMSPL